MTAYRKAAGIILVVAAALRLPLLDRRPMHADEAILADKFGTLLATGSYPYDPREYHGPGLAHLAWIPAHLTGRTTYPALTETTLRVAPAITGILLALSPLLLVPAIGVNAGIAAAALLAVSPAMVYYSRYFIAEIPLALWTALLLAAVLRRWWLVAGGAAALMIATKETAVIALVSAAVAYAVAFRPRRPDYRAMAGFAAALLIGIWILMAPPWRWGVLAQVAVFYFQRGVGGGIHDHPWYTYFRWLAGELPILVLAVLGARAGWHMGRAVRFLLIYTALLLAIYSAIPYKTPWCAISGLYGLALAAGIGIEGLRAHRLVVTAAVVVVLAGEAWLLSFPLAADPRNPWVYAHTTAGVFEIRDRVAEFARAAPEGERVAIDIYTRENLWPLPWYFRRFPNQRWWRQVAIPGAAAPIVLVSPALEADLVRKLYEGPPPGERELYMDMFGHEVDLRPQVEVRGYVAKSLWDRKEQESPR